MERSTIHLLAKRGRSIRQIAAELGRSPTTISRVLQEPVDRPPAKRYRRSKVDPYRAQIERWVGEGLTAERMLELARAAPLRGAARRVPAGRLGRGPRLPIHPAGVGDALLPRVPPQAQPLGLGALRRRHAPGDPLPRPDRLL